MAKQTGFTLIELLVVIVLMATVFALVGPLGNIALERIKASDEWYDAVKITRHYQSQAFLTSQPAYLTFEGKLLAVDFGGQNVRYEFEQLFFTPQNIVFSANGFASQPQLNAMQRRQPQTLTLLPAGATLLGVGF
ncbi:pilus assembly FimT family protein [Rheinheimera gaetbuli]